MYTRMLARNDAGGLSMLGSTVLVFSMADMANSQGGREDYGTVVDLVLYF